MLFGRESDLTDAELDEELQACGIDPVELQADVPQTAHSIMRTITTERWIGKFLKTLREHSKHFGLRGAADKAKAVVRSAETLVGNFLGYSKGQVIGDIERSFCPLTAQQPQFAFRNKKDLSASDKALLQSEQDDGRFFRRLMKGDAR